MDDEKLRERLEGLQQEYASGQKLLAEYREKEADLQRTLLRIEGAITVLREIMGVEDNSGEQPPDAG